MKRWVVLVLVSLAVPVAAKKNNAAEALQVLDRFLSGQVGLNATVNRVQYLGAEALVAEELALVLKRTRDPKRREPQIELLAAVAVPSEDVERLLLTSLRSDTVGEVMAACRGLGRTRPRDAVGPLVGLLGHPVLGVRREATRALGAIGQPGAGGPLLKAAKTEVDLELRLQMIVAAGRAGDRKQAPALEALLGDSSESTRLAAAQALCTLGAPRCAKFAAALLGAADRHERLQGVMLFEGAKAKLAAPSLTPLLKDADHKVRARAARLLVEGGDARQLEFLVIESARAGGESKLAYEDELERLRLSDEQRQAILKRAGLQ